MDVLIIEDETLAAERLQLLLKQYDDSINIKACLDSIEDAVQWLQTKPHPDLVLLDIHLSDGHCFEIFKKVDLRKPVIFTTAYDHYAIDAFQHFSIDYILKPVTAEAMAAAINKYKSLATALLPPAWSEQLRAHFTPRYKDRFLAKIGQRSFFITADEVAYFMADNKIVYLIDRDGNRFIINNTLEKLEPLLHPHSFFRVNRKIIIHSNAIEQVKPYYNNRLKLILKGNKPGEDIIISRERVADFKTWAET